MYKRHDGRSHDQLRPLRITPDVFEYASGSVLYEIGKTKVLCAVTLQQGVPPFLRNKKTGWLTAEYAMLPAATQVRTVRECSSVKRNGRSIEISRLIGRVLRTVVNLDLIGERTIVVDCDVQQADGGTRTASITGAFLALKMASDRWLASGLIEESIIRDEVAAVSVGIRDGVALLDVDYVEDSSLDVDVTMVLTKAGGLVEIQASAEKKPLDWRQFETVRSLAQSGVAEIFDRCMVTEKTPSTQASWPLHATVVQEKNIERE